MDSIDRVISDEDTKTYEMKATLLILDDKVPGNKYEGAEMYWENPVQVLDSEERVIGAATIFRDGKRIEAELFIDYSTPERLTIETQTGKLHAHPSILEAMDNSEGEWRVIFGNIKNVIISGHMQPDDRIVPL